MRQSKILLMEDDAILGYALKEYLELHKYQVSWEQDGTTGVDRFAAEPFHLCIIDIMMPEKDGFSAAKEIKSLDEQVPFLFLTARSQKIDKLKGFSLGAEDFIVKPVDEEELIARIEVVMRRGANGSLNREPHFVLGAFSFYPEKQRLVREEKRIDLTSKETQLLQMLCDKMGHLLTRDEALTQIWGSSDYFTRRTMDVHIARLRNYLKPEKSVKIKNVHGKGFILE